MGKATAPPAAWRCRILSLPDAAGSPHPHTPAGLSARGRYDHKLDVFSFGLLLWEWFARELVHREIEVS